MRTFNICFTPVIPSVRLTFQTLILDFSISFLILFATEKFSPRPHLPFIAIIYNSFIKLTAQNFLDVDFKASPNLLRGGGVKIFSETVSQECRRRFKSHLKIYNGLNSLN